MYIVFVLFKRRLEVAQKRIQIEQPQIGVHVSMKRLINMHHQRTMLQCYRLFLK